MDQQARWHVSPASAVAAQDAPEPEPAPVNPWRGMWRSPQRTVRGLMAWEGRPSWILWSRLQGSIRRFCRWRISLRTHLRAARSNRQFGSLAASHALEVEGSPSRVDAVVTPRPASAAGCAGDCDGGGVGLPVRGVEITGDETQASAASSLSVQKTANTAKRQHRAEEQSFLPPRPSAIAAPPPPASTLAAIRPSGFRNAALRSTAGEPFSDSGHASDREGN